MSEKLVHRALEWIETHRFELDSPVPALWDRLKSISRVEQSESVPTACLKQAGKQKVICYNNSFVSNKVCGGENSLLNMSLVLLHEACHEWRADLYFPRKRFPEYFWNLTCDLTIHHELFAAGFPQAETLTDRLYELTEISALLIPPQHLLPRLAELAAAEQKPEWQYDGSVTEPAHFKRLFSWLSDNLEPLWRPNLPWKNETVPPVDRLVRLYIKAWAGGISRQSLYQQLLEIIEVKSEFEVFTLGSHGRGRGDAENREDPGPSRRALRISRFVQYLRKALVQTSTSNSQVRRRVKSRGVKPAATRRSTFLLAGGSWPVFFQRQLHQQAEQERGAHIYLDSSGSIPRDFVDLVSALLIGCAELVAKPVHLFSRTVEDVSLERLKDGYRITGGTCIEPVLRHARERKLNKFIVLTDGYVGKELPPELRSYLESASMFVLFTELAQPPLKETAARYWTQVKTKLGE